MDTLTFVFSVLVLGVVAGVIWLFRSELKGILSRTIKLDINATGGSLEALPPPPAPTGLPDIAPKAEAPAEPLPIEQDRNESIEKQQASEGASLWRAYIALREGDIVRADEIFSEHLETVTDEDVRFEEEAFFLHLKMLQGSTDDAFRQLISLHASAKNDRQFSNSTSLVAGGYDRVRDFENEESVWRDAIAKVRDERISTTFFVGLAKVFDKTGRIDEGIALLVDRIHDVVERESKATLYLALSELHKKLGQTEIAAIALEKSVEHAPGDRERLFAAAYLQSEQRLKLLAITNYQTLIGLDPTNATALNNLGVCAGEVSIEGKKIALFELAQKHGSTLATSNLANEKINAGFYDEAEQILNVARVKENPDENVGQVLFRLEKNRKEETQRWEVIVEKSAQFQRRVRAYGDALFSGPAPSNAWDGVWYTSRGDEVTVAVSDNVVSASWTEAKTGLGFLVAGTNGDRDVLSAIGHIHGRAARVVWHKAEKSHKRGAVTSLLSSSEREMVACYSYLSGDSQKWYFFSIETGSEKDFVLTRWKPE